VRLSEVIYCFPAFFFPSLQLLHLNLVYWFLARQDYCLESYCHDPGVGVSVTPQGKKYNLGYIF
jgi:hypothetical protein